MAGTVQVAQTPTTSGVAPTYIAVAAQNEVPCSGGTTFIHVKNGSGASINVTLKSQLSVDGGATSATDKVVAVPAGAERMIGPITPGIYAQANGNAEVDFSATATVTMAVYTIAR